MVLSRSPHERRWDVCPVQPSSIWRDGGFAALGAGCRRVAPLMMHFLPINRAQAMTRVGAQNVEDLAEECWKCADIGEVACTLGESVPVEGR